MPGRFPRFGRSRHGGGFAGTSGAHTDGEEGAGASEMVDQGALAGVEFAAVLGLQLLADVLDVGAGQDMPGGGVRCSVHAVFGGQNCGGGQQSLVVAHQLGFAVGALQCRWGGGELRGRQRDHTGSGVVDDSVDRSSALVWIIERDGRQVCFGCAAQ